MAGHNDSDGSTHSRMKNSWKRSSLVSSGWNVVRRCLPCLRATIVRGSRGSVSSSSRGTFVCNGGSREADMREITWIGGSDGVGFKERTTCWPHEPQTITGRENGTYGCPNEHTMEGSVRITQSLYLQWSLERLNLRESVLRRRSEAQG